MFKYLYPIIIFSFVMTLRPMFDTEKEFDRMESEIKSRFDSMRKLFFGSDDKSEKQAKLTINKKEVISIEKKDNKAVITIEMPKASRLDAQVVDGKVLITDLDKKNNTVQLIAKDSYLQAIISYEAKEENQDSESYSSFQSNQTFSLSYQIDFSDSKNIEISYDSGKLIILAPIIKSQATPSKIPVNVISSTSDVSKTSQSFVSNSKLHDNNNGTENNNSKPDKPEPKRIKFVDSKKNESKEL